MTYEKNRIEAFKALKTEAKLSNRCIRIFQKFLTAGAKPSIFLVNIFHISAWLHNASGLPTMHQTKAMAKLVVDFFYETLFKKWGIDFKSIAFITKPMAWSNARFSVEVGLPVNIGEDGNKQINLEKPHRFGVFMDSFGVN